MNSAVDSLSPRAARCCTLHFVGEMQRLMPCTGRVLHDIDWHSCRLPTAGLTLNAPAEVVHAYPFTIFFKKLNVQWTQNLTWITGEPYSIYSVTRKFWDTVMTLVNHHFISGDVVVRS